mgnify:CR=1 FL=1
MILTDNTWKLFVLTMLIAAGGPSCTHRLETLPATKLVRATTQLRYLAAKRRDIAAGVSIGGDIDIARALWGNSNRKTHWAAFAHGGEVQFFLHGPADIAEVRLEFTQRVVLSEWRSTNLELLVGDAAPSPFYLSRGSAVARVPMVRASTFTIRAAMTRPYSHVLFSKMKVRAKYVGASGTHAGPWVTGIVAAATPIEFRDPRALVDGNPSTAWCGHEAMVMPPKRADVSSVVIRNGISPMSPVRGDHPRVSVLMFNGERLRLADIHKRQRLIVRKNFRKVTSISIREVSANTQGRKDGCLAEVELVPSHMSSLPAAKNNIIGGCVYGLCAGVVPTPAQLTGLGLPRACYNRTNIFECQYGMKSEWRLKNVAVGKKTKLDRLDLTVEAGIITKVSATVTLDVSSRDYLAALRKHYATKEKSRTGYNRSNYWEFDFSATRFLASLSGSLKRGNSRATVSYQASVRDLDPALRDAQTWTLRELEDANTKPEESQKLQRRAAARKRAETMAREARKSAKERKIREVLP